MRHTLRTALVLLCSWQTAFAQPVTFTYVGPLINPASVGIIHPDCAVDMNGDHLDDVVRVGHKGIFVDHQQTDGSFSQKFYPVSIQTPPVWSICAGDIDNNGYNDLLFGGHTAVSFVTTGPGGDAYGEKVMAAPIFSQRSTLADIDNDGWLDGFVCNDIDQSIPFRNDGAGAMYPDTTLIYTADRPGNYAAIWTDYDNDGDIDLYITKCLGGAPAGNINRTNLLYRNEGNGAFVEAGAEAGLDDNAQSWSTVFEDFDNDGDFDAFIVNHDFKNRLFRNNGDGAFTDVIGNSGIDASDLGAWENASGDFNNDGFMDIFSGLQRELYLGNGDLTFTGQDAPAIPGAVADLNDDGFLDVLKDGQPWINTGNGNHWLKVIPLGISGNRNGIGARVEIYGAWGVQVREIRAGQSYSPMSSLAVHFGLGASALADSLKVRWPSGIVTRVQNLAADTTYVVPEAPCLLPSGSITVENGAQGICPGDTARLLAPEGFLQYRWSNNQTGPLLRVSNEGGFFAFCIDSAGCVSLTQRVEIQVINDAAPAIFSPQGNVVCQGDTLVLFATPAETYYWSDGTLGAQYLSVTESGSYTVATDAFCVPGLVTSAPYAVTVLPAYPPVVADTVIASGDSILLTASGENCRWFDMPTGGNLLAMGPEFQTTPLGANSTFYVESHFFYPGETQQGGKPDTSALGGLPAQSGDLLFEVWEPFTLQSVTVYVPPGTPFANRVIELRSGSVLLASKQFSVLTGFNEIPLNFEVPVGEFSLRCPQGKLWRDTGQLNYPYPVGDAGQITASGFGDHFYYYFYNWKIRKYDHACVSVRVAVNVAVTGVAGQTINPGLSLFPNPSGGLFFVELKDEADGAYGCIVADAYGREVYRKALDGVRAFQLDLSGLPAGLYQLRVFGAGYSTSGISLLKL